MSKGKDKVLVIDSGGRELAYKGVEGVHFENAFYRTDIAEKGIRRLEK